MNFYTDKDGNRFYYLGNIDYTQNHNYRFALLNNIQHIQSIDKSSKFMIHRECGPAIKFNNGCKWWVFNGKDHRLDGPACEYDNNKIWYYYGQKIDCKSQKEFEKIIKMKAFI